MVPRERPERLPGKTQPAAAAAAAEATETTPPEAEAPKVYVKSCGRNQHKPDCRCHLPRVVEIPGVVGIPVAVKTCGRHQHKPGCQCHRSKGEVAAQRSSSRASSAPTTSRAAAPGQRLRVREPQPPASGAEPSRKRKRLPGKHSTRLSTKAGDNNTATARTEIRRESSSALERFFGLCTNYC